MTTPQELEQLVERLRKHALPDPHDEREVLHAPLLHEAADALSRLSKEHAAKDAARIEKWSVSVAEQRERAEAAESSLTLERERSAKLREALRELIEHEQYAAISYRGIASRPSAEFDAKRRWERARSALQSQD